MMQRTVSIYPNIALLCVEHLLSMISEYRLT